MNREIYCAPSHTRQRKSLAFLHTYDHFSSHDENVSHVWGGEENFCIRSAKSVKNALT
jgi:hypothetical protein